MSTTADFGMVTQLALVDTYTDDSGVIRVALGSEQRPSSLRITPSFGAIWYTGLDIGFPSVRDVSSILPDMDGTFDETARLGARAVSLSLIVLDHAYDQYLPEQTAGWNRTIHQWDSAAYWVEQLAGWMHPMRRPRLYYRLATSPNHTRWLDLRASGSSSPFVMDRPGHREVQLQWVSPSGRINGFDERPFDGNSGGTGDGRTIVRVAATNLSNPVEMQGREYPEPAPYLRNYPVPVPIPIQVFNPGTLQTGFVAKLFPPHTGSTPASVSNIHFEVTGQDFSTWGGFALNITLQAPDYLLVDTFQRRVWRVNGVGGTLTPMDQYLAAPIKWPQLWPGINYVEYTCDSSESGDPDFDAYTDIIFHPAYLM